MAQISKIEWTQVTWNPVTGCTKVSEGCSNCYAERMALRLKAMGSKRYQHGFYLTLHHDLVTLPLRWKKPRVIFVNSMSDLFHEDIPLPFIREVFETMKKAHWHVFQIITKRAERLADLSNKISWPSNVWIGVTVESHKYLYRIDDLRKVPALVRFVSIEPLLSDLQDFSLEGIDWIIVGGESGPQSRVMDAAWARNIREQCIRADVPFFFKQWGGFKKSKNGRMLDGCIWNEMPLKADMAQFALE
ncbi:MAG: phage Gp37/Gp68 family protein [Nitrospirales bacterium]|nr:phage Gp37/Gp68 family protein [Nitrospirales bacterium]